MRWESTHLGDVATVEREIVEPKAIASGTLYVGLEHIVTGGRFDGVGPVEAGDLASAKFAFDDRHVLFGKLRPYLAKVARPSFRGVCSTDILPILPGPRVDRDFLARHLLQPESVAIANAWATGANLPRLSPSALAKLPVPLPPLAEQRRIADILDRADAMRAKRRDAIGLCESLSTAIFSEMFPASAGFSSIALGDVAEVQGGLQVSHARSDLPMETPYLRVANVLRGALDLGVIKTIRLTIAELERTLLSAGDLLLVEGHGNPGEVGRCAVWSGDVSPCVHQNHLIRARCDARVANPQYVADYLNSPGGRRHLIRAGNTTSGLNTISVADVRSAPVLLPALDRQTEYVRRSAAIGKLKAAHRASLAEMDVLFSSLQHRAFRGEL